MKNLIIGLIIIATVSYFIGESLTTDFETTQNARIAQLDKI